VEALGRNDAALTSAGAELLRHAAQLAAIAARLVSLIHQGVYPTDLDAAGRAVERWREAVTTVTARSPA
jgi:hypothetical protein